MLAQLSMFDPVRNRFSCLFSNFKLHCLMSFLLHDHRSTGNSCPMKNIPDPDLYKVTAPELAIDSQIEQCEIPATI
jgi:hypothetical protein